MFAEHGPKLPAAARTLLLFHRDYDEWLRALEKEEEACPTVPSAATKELFSNPNPASAAHDQLKPGHVATLGAKNTALSTGLAAAKAKTARGAMAAAATCAACGGPHHVRACTADVFVAGKTEKRLIRACRCYGCSKFGHPQSVCPDRPGGHPNGPAPMVGGLNR